MLLNLNVKSWSLFNGYVFILRIETVTMVLRTANGAHQE